MMLLRAALLASTCLSIAPGLGAHEDEKFLRDRQPPWQGAGYRRDSGLPPGAGFASSGITLLSWLTLADLDPAATSGSDCWGYVSPSGREYALVGQSNGTTVVEVTNPAAPVVVARIDGPDSLWRDIKVYRSYCYAVSEGGSGIQVIDLSDVDAGNVTLVANNVTGTGTTASHNVAINEDSGYLYRVGGGSGPGEGLRMYSLADPANPTFEGAWNGRYVHDAQVVTYQSPQSGALEVALCFASSTSAGNNPGLAVVVVNNKNNPWEMAFYPYSNAAFCHQGWLSPDRNLLYLNDEMDESDFGMPTTTRILDVSLLGSPREVGTFTNGNSAIDHNLYTRGNYIYEANYRSGLRIFDASDPLAPVEVAFYDTYAADDDPSFNGLWNVYPYLPSGVLLGSDLEKGLFVWWHGVPSLDITFPGGVPERFDPTGEVVLVQIDEANSGDLMAGTAELHVDVGSGPQTVPLSPLGGGLFQGAVPPSTCGDLVSFHVTARSGNGVTWSEPAGAPAQEYRALSTLGTVVRFTDDAEVDRGWTVGAAGDTASRGVWTRGDPLGTEAQPEDDHTADPARDCWFTGQGSGGASGESDVDGGATTLLSPQFDLRTLSDPVVSYWRWFSNDTGANPGEDTLEVSVSNDAGLTWVTLETVGPTGGETTGGWLRHAAKVADFVALTDQVQFRFRVADDNGGSVVEAALDDFAIHDNVCVHPALTLTGNPEPGGNLTLTFQVDAGDTLFAVYGLPPRVSIPTPPFGGELSVFPNFTLTIQHNLATDEFVLNGGLPSDPMLSGLEILFQGLAGPVLAGSGASGAWTNCATLHVR